MPIGKMFGTNENRVAKCFGGSGGENDYRVAETLKVKL